MKNAIRVLLPLLAVVVACSPLMYGKIDAPSVVVSRTLPSTPGVTTPSAITIPPLTFDFSIGDITVSESDKDSSLTLNAAKLSVGEGSTTTVDLEEVDVLVVSLTAPGGTASVDVARYDRNAGVGTLSQDHRTITLAPVTQENLLGYLSQKTFKVTVSGSGKPPGPIGTSWIPEIALDFHVIAQQNVL